MATGYRLSYTAAQINKRLGKIDTLAEKSELPSKLSELTNDKGFATESYVNNAIANIDIPEVDLSSYALKSEIPKDYLKSVPEEYITETELNAKKYLTSFTETDPTVPAWAKAATKPTYTAGEIGALPADTVIPTVPTKVSAFENDSGYLTEHQDISGKLDADKLPEAINTALAEAKASGEFDGKDGRGIESVILPDDGTMEVHYTDGDIDSFPLPGGSGGAGFLYYNASGLEPADVYVSLGELGVPDGYIPKVGDFVLCADGKVFKIVGITELTGAELAATEFGLDCGEKVDLSDYALKTDILSLDTTLSVEGKAADAKAVGDVLAKNKYIAQDTAPDDTNVLWVDTSDDTSDFEQISIDSTLSLNGYAADAKVVGDALSEVVADASDTASSLVSAHNTATDAHADIREEIAQVSSEVDSLKKIYIGDTAPTDISDGTIWIDTSEE